MSADLHIHIKSDELTERDLRNAAQPFAPYQEKDKAYEKMSECEGVWVGEVSWLSRMFGDENAVPELVQKVAELIPGDGFTKVTNEMISEIEDYLVLPNTTSYATAGEEVITFLREHIGKQAFTVSW